MINRTMNVEVEFKDKVESFDSVMDQPNVVKVSFFKGKVPDLSPLAQLPRLAALWFDSKSKPSSFAPLKVFPSLISLRMHSQFELLNGLDLPLTYLSIDGSSMTDFSWLRPSQTLKWFSASYNWNMVDDSAVLPDLPNLEIFSLLSRQLTTLAHLNLPKGLRSLYVASNKKLKHLDGIENCKQLKQLDVFKTSISSIDNVPADELTHLTASLTKIKTVHKWHAPLLRQANFHKTPIKTLDGFDQFQSLEKLNLSSTKISDLSLLKDLKNLKHLSLANCQNIRTFVTLSNNRQLETLDVSNTPIRVSEAHRLLEIPSLKRINLARTEACELKSTSTTKVFGDIFNWQDPTTYDVHRAVEFLDLSLANALYPLEVLQRLGWTDILKE